MRGNGATNVRHRSSNATHLPSGDGTICVALSLRKCTISSRPGSGEPPVGNADAQQRELLVADFADEDARAGVIELRLGCRLRARAAARRPRSAPRRCRARRRSTGCARMIAADVAEHDRACRRARTTARCSGRGAVDDIARRRMPSGLTTRTRPWSRVGPRRVDNPLTVARERRGELERARPWSTGAAGRPAATCTYRCAERAVGDALAVGRRRATSRSILHRELVRDGPSAGSAPRR